MASKFILKAHLALFSVNIIYGANYLIAKGLMPQVIRPSALVFLRIAGAGFAFYLLQLFSKEKVDRKDYPRLVLCGILGVATNQYFSMNGLSLTSPVDAAIIVTAMPIFTIAISYLLLKEPITKLKVTGVILGAIGALALIYLGKMSIGGGSLKGNIFILINALTFSFYLVLVKPLMTKYKPITVISRVFYFGFIAMLPFCVQPLLSTDFGIFTSQNWFSLSYVVIGPTFLAYILNMYALQYVKPTVSSSYIYVQPAVAMILVAVLSYFISNSDYKGDITFTKLICCVFICLGVYLTSKNKV